MKGKFLSVAVLVILGLALLFDGRQASAGIDPVIALNNVYSALNSGQVETALSLFAEDGTAENLVRKETYQGTNEIREMLQGMQKEGRLYDIVNVEMDGDTITVRVEVSDRGIVWGTQTSEAVINGGRLQTFTVKDIRLQLWRIGQK